MGLYNTKFDSSIEQKSISAGSQNILTQPLYAKGDRASFIETLGETQAPTLTLYWTTDREIALLSDSENIKPIPRFLKAPFFKNAQPLQFNDEVNCFLWKDRTLYAGGSFKTYNNYHTNGTCALDIDTLTVTENFLEKYGPFKGRAEIRAVASWNDLIIIGGNYEGNSRKQSLFGRGLNIVDTKQNLIFPFYVDGEVNTFHIHNNDLYVGGNFSSVNYTAQKASVYTDLIVKCNGLFKINLPLLHNFSHQSIDKNFILKVSSEEVPNTTTIINSIISLNDNIVVGGKFNYNSRSNLAILDTNGDLTEWKPLVNGEVRGLMFEDNKLYVGGEFDYVSTHDKFEINNFNQTIFRANNAVRYLFDGTGIIPDPSWRPSFNGGVACFLLKDEVVYCYGNFTAVNESSAGYLAAIDERNGQPLWWPHNLQSGPTKNNKALFALVNSIIVGGTFLEYNKTQKGHIVSVPYYSPKNQPNFTIKFDVDVQVFSHGTSLEEKPASFKQVECIPGDPLTINTTQIKMISKDLNGCSPGTLLKFSITKNEDIPIYLLGWKLD